ncbi:MAG: peptidoglycan-binding domain-containing protein [Sulfitobacter sp.]
MATKLTGSVGRKGKNAPEDVKAVQNLLNGFAGMLKFAKLKVDGTSSASLEKAIGLFQTEVCGFKADCRVDVGKDTIKQLDAGASKAAAERKAKAKKMVKAIEDERAKMLAKVMKSAEKHVNRAGLPLIAADILFKGAEAVAKDRIDKLLQAGEDLYKVDPKNIVAAVTAGLIATEKNMQAALARLLKERVSMLNQIQKSAAQQVKKVIKTGAAGAGVVKDIEDYAVEQWEWLLSKGKGGSGDPKDIAKIVGEVVKGAESHISTLIEEAAGECGPDEKVPLVLKGSEDLKVTSACFKFAVSGKSPDPKSKVLLCLDTRDNNIDITKGYSKACVPGLFKLIDDKKLWGKKVNFFAIETTDGKPDNKTKSNYVILNTPVEPFKGTISYTGLGADKTLKYTGNGHGRLLSYTKINGWYFFKHGGKFERDPAMRGFDCITYVGTANKVSSGMDGRGDKLANKLGASQIAMEDKTKAEIVTFFEGDGKVGKYIGWWSTHCFTILNGTVHEWSQGGGGYRTTKATSFGWKNKGNYVRKL